MHRHSWNETWREWIQTVRAQTFLSSACAWLSSIRWERSCLKLAKSSTCRACFLKEARTSSSLTLAPYSIWWIRFWIWVISWRSARIWGFRLGCKHMPAVFSWRPNTFRMKQLKVVRLRDLRFTKIKLWRTQRISWHQLLMAIQGTERYQRWWGQTVWIRGRSII